MGLDACCLARGRPLTVPQLLWVEVAGPRVVLDEATEAESPLIPLAGVMAGRAATMLESSQAFELLDTASDEDCPSEDPGGVKPVAWADMAPTTIRARGKVGTQDLYTTPWV